MVSTNESKPTVLVVDDHHPTAYAVAKMLTHAGFKVRQAFTGLAAIRTANILPAVIILDVHLPDINGFDVCRRLRSDPRTAKIPILFLSSTFDFVRGKVEAAKCGAQAFLSHPIAPAQLAEAIESALQEAS